MTLPRPPGRKTVRKKLTRVRISREPQPPVTITLALTSGAAPEPAPTEAAPTEGDAKHTDEAGTGVLPPSPTGSANCEPHGDHWHCDAEAAETSGAEEEDEDEAPETTKTRKVSTTTRDSDDVAVKTDVPGSAGRVAMGALLPLAGAVAAFAL